MSKPPPLPDSLAAWAAGPGPSPSVQRSISLGSFRYAPYGTPDRRPSGDGLGPKTLSFNGSGAGINTDVSLSNTANPSATTTAGDSS